MSAGTQKGFGVVGACLLAAASFVACSSDGGSDAPPMTASVGGGTAADPNRLSRGEITVLGASDAVLTNSRSFTGPPSVAQPGQDQVGCAFAPLGRITTVGTLAPPNVTLSASISGRTRPQVQLSIFDVRSAAPFEKELGFDEQASFQSAFLLARLSHDSDSSYYEYSYSVDASVLPSVDSRCSVEVTTFSEQHIIGQIACRDLVASSDSRDATVLGPRSRANITVAFDCPVQVVDEQGRPLAAPSGAGGAGGAGGSSGAGGANAGGSSAGGKSGSSGSAAGSSGAGGPPVAMGVGAPCSGSADCTSPLSCHFDSADYIAHMQCAVSCSDSETCAQQFGAGSFCIGAHICVRGCKSDLDCASKTHCNSAGWCERTGPGSGVPYCAGYPTSCSLLSDLECIGAYGCTDNSECAGVSTSCYSLFDSFSCSSQDGCYWSTSTKSCSGSSYSCHSYSSELSCEYQEGCYWTGGCTGVPEPCEKKSIYSCANQPGCQLRTD